MLVALAYHSGDRLNTERLRDWMVDLGGCEGHSLLLVEDMTVAPVKGWPFGQVHREVTNPIRQEWPYGPNVAFQTAARWIAHKMPQPWLWIEPDAVPMVPGWLDKLWAEYIANRKLFMGDYVTATHGNQSISYMSGVGIYPDHVVRHAGSAMNATSQPWDVAGRKEIVAKMHPTKLIQHNWRRPKFRDMEEVKRIIRPECVLYHASKDGSLIQLLREARGLQATLPSAGDLGCNPSSTSRETSAAGGSSFPEPALSPAAELPLIPASAEATQLEQRLRSLFSNGNGVRSQAKALVQELRALGTCPAYRTQVREELAIAGFIKMRGKYAKRRVQRARYRQTRELNKAQIQG